MQTHEKGSMHGTSPRTKENSITPSVQYHDFLGSFDYLKSVLKSQRKAGEFVGFNKNVCADTSMYNSLRAIVILIVSSYI